MIKYKDADYLLRYDSKDGKLYWKNRSSNRIKVGDEAGHIVAAGYIAVGIKGRLYYGHRLAWLLSTGDWPKIQIDHINGVRSDNRIENLREATSADNSQNKRNLNGRLLGAYLHKKSGRYLSMIGINGKSKYLGYFDTKEQAHMAYVSEKRKLHSFCTI